MSSSLPRSNQQPCGAAPLAASRHGGPGRGTRERRRSAAPKTLFGAGLLLTVGASAFAGDITTFAGGGAADGGPATAANLQPHGITTMPDGDLVIADFFGNRVRRVSASTGTITTIAGTGVQGLGGDGGPATEAVLSLPSDVVADFAGNVYVATGGNGRVRRVDGATGVITTYAGGGASGLLGDGGLATDAGPFYAYKLALDAAGNLFIGDFSAGRVRRVDAGSGIITTVAGNGTSGFSGDGGLATSAGIGSPAGLAIDEHGNLFLSGLYRVRRVDATTGLITTVAGTGVPGSSGDDGPATQAQIRPLGIAFDAQGNLLVADSGRVRRVHRTTGIITTVAGDGTNGWSGDGGLAPSASLTAISLCLSASGDLFIGGSARVRKVAAATNVITTIAGNGEIFDSGDGGPATNAALRPGPLAFDAAGNLFIASGSRIRRVDAGSGVVTTVAGNGATGMPSGDGGPAIDATIPVVNGLAVHGDGTLYLSTTVNSDGYVRRVDGTTGTISTIAGAGTNYNGDGGPAAAVRFYGGVAEIVLDPAGNLLVVEPTRHRVRKIDLGTGIITTVAGTFQGAGYSGDGGPATSARLRNPRSIAVDGAGNLFISDLQNYCIRRVDAVTGVITTVAPFPWCEAVVADAFGNLYTAEFAGVWLVNAATGEKSLFAGGAYQGPLGDGGPATKAVLGPARGLALDADGLHLYVSTGNGGNNLGPVRRIHTATVTGPESLVQSCDGTERHATVNLLLQVTEKLPAGATLVVTDTTGGRTLYSGPAAVGAVGVGPVDFPMGPSVVQARLWGGTEVLSTATINVQIEDTIPPLLQGATNPTLELTGSLTEVTPALLGITATDDCDPNPTVTLVPSALAPGQTSVEVTARDASGNTSTSTVLVTVEDTTPPVFDVCPEDIEVACVDGAEGVLVTFEVRAFDLSGQVVLVSRDETGRELDGSGARFGVGSHLVTTTAEDGSGRTATCSFLVEVVDRSDPVIVCPQDRVVDTDPGDAVAHVEFEVMASDDCDPAVSVVCRATWGEVVSGDAFPAGSTEVVCTARDHAGNDAVCSFRILVQDREAPRITAASTVTLVTDCAGRDLAISPTTLGAFAVDNGDPSPNVVCSPTSVAVGTQTVTVTATDASGNVAEATLAVRVLRGPYDVQFLRPLDGNVDNLINRGQTVALKVRVTCANAFASGATVEIDSIARIDGAGTPIANVATEDAGVSADGGITMRVAGDSYAYNLSTKSWSGDAGSRFRVTLRVRETDRADTIASVVLKTR